MAPGVSDTLVAVRGLLLFPFFLGLLARAESGQNPGFAHHIQEAISANWNRTAGYARQTQGRSRYLSHTLMAVEAGTLPIAWYLDRQAAPFQRAGIPIMQLDFVSMSLTPPFSETGLAPLPPSIEYRPIPWRRWKRRILELSRARQFLALHAEIQIWVKDLEETPRFHAMVRHVLESTARIAFLAPQYERMALRAGLTSSPVPLSQNLLWLHASSLWISNQLDNWAEPMQREGVAILQNDVPPIEMSPWVKPPPGPNASCGEHLNQ